MLLVPAGKSLAPATDISRPKGSRRAAAPTSLDWMARRASVKGISLNVFCRSSPYSLLSTSAILALASPPITPMRRPFNLSMLSMAEPGGATMRTTMWLTTTTAFACDRSPTSPRTTARSTLPVENALAASSAVPLSITLRRTGALVATTSACHGGHHLGRFAVDGADRHAQGHRARIVPIGEQAGACRKTNHSDQQDKTKPEWQIQRGHTRLLCAIADQALAPPALLVHLMTASFPGHLPVAPPSNENTRFQSFFMSTTPLRVLLGDCVPRRRNLLFYRIQVEARAFLHRRKLNGRSEPAFSTCCWT